MLQLQKLQRAQLTAQYTHSSYWERVMRWISLNRSPRLERSLRNAQGQTVPGQVLRHRAAETRHSSCSYGVLGVLATCRTPTARSQPSW